MTGESLFWIGVVLYSVVLLFALYMTRSEQLRNHVPFVGALVGFLGCIVWPVTFSVMLVSALWSTESRRSLFK